MTCDIGDVPMFGRSVNRHRAVQRTAADTRFALSSVLVCRCPSARVQASDTKRNTQPFQDRSEVPSGRLDRQQIRLEFKAGIRCPRLVA
jgi:hypothetical protein